jgi:uncharacterized protein (TIGR01777 family)
MKHYLISGGTGLIGSALCQQLIAVGHEVTVLSRKPDTVEEKCGVGIKAVQSLTDITPDTTIDIVINLAGEPIANARWTDKRKKLLESSRIELTAEIVDWISSRKQKPECLISGSAVGWYGDGGDQVLTEQSTSSYEYTHRLCDAWEKEALLAAEMGVRVCIVRTGLVLSSSGGVLQKMLLPFKLGLGGNLGSGEQYMPWIHISDMIRLLYFLATDKRLTGVFNACSPNPVTNQEFTIEFTKRLHRYSLFSVPAWALKIVLGEMSRLLLTGQRALPQRAIENGFSFTYPALKPALKNILDNE